MSSDNNSIPTPLPEPDSKAPGIAPSGRSAASRHAATLVAAVVLLAAGAAAGAGGLSLMWAA